MTETHDEFTLLCEGCGYVLHGLPRSSACPECGRPIAASLPEARPGTPWQRTGGAAAWVNTSLQTVLRPRDVFGRVRPGDRDGVLLRVNCTVAGALLTGGWWWSREPGGMSLAGALLGAGAVFAGSVIGLLVLTWIERVGLVFFSRRRSERLTRPMASSICAHASVGWLLAGVLAFAGVGAVEVLRLEPWVARPAPNVVVIHAWVVSVPPAAGFFTGLMVFEVLAYVGARRCRFANSTPGTAKGDA